MKIPYTIPELILRVYTRKLTPEKVVREREGRRIRAEDANWDNEKHFVPCTLANFCLQSIVKNYKDFEELLDETNRRYHAIYDQGFEEWQKLVDQYRLQIEEFEEKRAELERKLADPYYFDDRTHDDEILEIPIAPDPPPDAPPPLSSVISVLDQLRVQDRVQVIQNFDPEELPLDVALRKIPDEYYWKQLAEEKFPEAHVGEYGNCWKRVFVEKSLREVIEFFHPRTGDFEHLDKEVERYAPFVKQLQLFHLIPACYGFPLKPVVPDVFEADEETVGDEDEGFEESEYMVKKKQAAEVTAIEDPSIDFRNDNSHIDFSLFIPKLTKLRTLTMIITMVEMGLDFEPRLVEFTSEDCANLANALAQSPHLHNFDLQRSRITGEQTKILVRDGFLHMRHLRSLNLSYNNLGNGGARALARLIIDEDSRVKYTLHTLILTSCHIKRRGAKALAYAIAMNDQIKHLCLRLNPIHDTGGKAIANALVMHKSMLILDLSATHIGDSTCKLLGKMMLHNNIIRSVNLSSNNSISSHGPGLIVKAVSMYKNTYKVDIRLTQTDKVIEFNIFHHVQKNLDHSGFIYLNRATAFKKTELKVPNPKYQLKIEELRRKAEEAAEEQEDEEEEEEEEEEEASAQDASGTSTDQDQDEDEDEEMETVMKPKQMLPFPFLMPPKAERIITREDMIIQRLIRVYKKHKDDTIIYDPYLKGKVLDNYIALMEEKTKVKEKVKKKRRRNSHWDIKNTPPRSAPRY